MLITLILVLVIYSMLEERAERSRMKEPVAVPPASRPAETPGD
jgi:hypothetical protein